VDLPAVSRKLLCGGGLEKTSRSGAQRSVHHALHAYADRKDRKRGWSSGPTRQSEKKRAPHDLTARRDPRGSENV
jgi:hypothetical protein